MTPHGTPRARAPPSRGTGRTTPPPVPQLGPRPAAADPSLRGYLFEGERIPSDGA